jgi:hypothetical protein
VRGSGKLDLMARGRKPAEEKLLRERVLSEYFSERASKAGKAAAAKMTPEQRRERARKAVAAREAKRKSTTLYHSTTESAAAQIEREGFKDFVAHYGMSVRVKGVWISDRALDQNEGCKGEVVLRLTARIDLSRLARYEVREEGKLYREWCIPASVVNRSFSIARLEAVAAREPKRKAAKEAK